MLELQELKLMYSLPTNSNPNTEKLSILKLNVERLKSENKRTRDELELKKQNLDVFSGTICNEFVEWLQEKCPENMSEIVDANSVVSIESLEVKVKNGRRSARFVEDEESSKKKQKLQETDRLVIDHINLEAFLNELIAIKSVNP